MANNNDLSLPSASRRSFLSLSAAASAALALRIVTEPMLAHARVHNFPKDAIRIDANENPLGPGRFGARGGRRHRSAGRPLFRLAHRRSGEDAGGDGRPEAGTGPRLCRIERAAASHGRRFRLTAAQLCDRRSGIRSRDVRRQCGWRESGESPADERLRP